MTGKLKVTVLYDLEEEEPAGVQEEAPPPPRRKGQKKRKKKPVKHDREEIFEALEKLGHEPSYYVSQRPPAIAARARPMRRRPHLQPHRSLSGDDTREMHVTAYLDLLDIPYTGAGRTRTFLPRTNPSPKRCSLLRDSVAYFATACAAPSITLTTSPFRSSSNPLPKMDPSASMPRRSSPP